MPIIKSAKKELRKGATRHARNIKIKDNLKGIIKKSLKAIEKKDAKAKELTLAAMKALDKAAQQGVIKKNTARRKKSRLHKRLNQLA